MQQSVHCHSRKAKSSPVPGRAPSSWAATTEFNFGKDLLYDFIGCANLLWSGKSLSHADLASTTRRLMPVIRGYLSGKKLPSEENNEIKSLNLESNYNFSSNMDILGIKLNHLKSGPVGNSKLMLPETRQSGEKNIIAVGSGQINLTGIPKKVTDIAINQDVSSLIFLHATARQADNQKGYRKIYNFQDTADLLGWYEVVYEDGFKLTIPIRYGVNILDVGAGMRNDDQWPQGKTGAPQNIYAYQTSYMECSDIADSSKAFFTYEWLNPRFGKKITSVSLHGIASYHNASGKLMRENAIMLLAISYTKKRPVPDVSIQSNEN